MNPVPISVEYFAQARAVAGRDGDTLSFAGPPTLLEVIRDVVRRHGPAMEALLMKDGGPSSAVVFAVDGRQAAANDDTRLHGGATVVVVPPISGGSR